MALTMDTVASVNGLTVTTTQGYTLTRIGNKSLREGDTIYTDGKYVYGMEGSGGKQLPILPSVNYYYMSHRQNVNCICGFTNTFREPKSIAKIGDYKCFYISSGGCWLYDYNNDYINVLTGEKIPCWNGIVSSMNKYIKDLDNISHIVNMPLYYGTGGYHYASDSKFLDVSVDGKGNLIHLVAFYAEGSPLNLDDPYFHGNGAALLINGKVSNIYYLQSKDCVYGNFYNDTDYQLIFLQYMTDPSDKKMVLYDSKDGKSKIVENYSCDIKIGIGIDGKPITMHCSGDHFSYYKNDYGLGNHKGITCDCMGYKVQGICSLRSACQIDADKYIFTTDDGIVLFNKKSKESRFLDNSFHEKVDIDPHFPVAGKIHIANINPHIAKLPYDMKRKIKSALRNF